MAKLGADSVQCIVTSPPYFGLRDYGVAGQIGLEESLDQYIEVLVEVFRAARRVLREDGTLWLNLGDSYARSLNKGGSSPGGKHENIPDYSAARELLAERVRSESQGSSDGAVGRADRAPVRMGGSGLKPKDLMMVPARVAMALQADGWWLRSDIIWHKMNPMPESVQDRPTSAHEHVFLLSKSETYYYDGDAIREPLAESSIARLSQNLDDQEGSERANGGVRADRPIRAAVRLDKQRGHSRRHAGFNDRWDAMSKDEQRALGANRRNVWSIATKPFSEAHFATFPPELAQICIAAGSREGDVVLDPFMGAATTLMVAHRMQRMGIGCELNPDYVKISERRLFQDGGMLTEIVKEVA
jgi:DNA modification methylase